MAYIPPQLAIDQAQDDRMRAATRLFAEGAGGLGQARIDALKLEEKKKKDLETAQKGEKLSFAKEGVSSDAIDQYHKTGDASGIQKFYQDAHSKDQDQKEAKRMADLKMAGVDFDYKKAQAAKLNSEAANPTEKMSDKAKIDYRAKVDQEVKQPGQNEFAAAGFAKRAKQAEEEFAKLPAGTGTDWKARVYGILPNEAMPENLQLMNQAKRNFISANLRKESGAAISDTEFVNEDKKYFPQPGDTPAVMEQKARAREQARLNLEAEGARAMPRIQDARKAPSKDPMQAIKAMTREEKLRILNGQ